MSVRTNPADVQAVLGPHYGPFPGQVTPPDLTIFIKTASGLVDFVATNDLDLIMSSDALETCETWLAAHCYAHADQLFKSKATGKAHAEFQGTTAMNLNSTQYGQMAMMCDLTGILAKRNKETELGYKKTVSAFLMTDNCYPPNCECP